MKLSDVFDDVYICLERLSYTNANGIEEFALKFKVRDELDSISVGNEEVYAKYRRIVNSPDKKLFIEAEYGIYSKLVQPVAASEEEIIQVIQENVNEYVRLAPSEASFGISSLTKCAGLPPLVTEPEFLEGK